MANLTFGELTLVELAKRTNNSKVMDVVDVLAVTNDWLFDAVHVEASNNTSHIGSRSIALPAGAHRILNAGVAEEFAQTRQIVEGLAMLEAYSKIDEDLVNKSGNSEKFRWQEDKLFLSGLSQTWASTIYAGNIAVDPEKIDGWATRTNSLGTMVKSAGGSGGDTTSVFFVQWGEDKCYMTYPIGDPNLGITNEDLGVETVLDASSNPYRAYRTHFKVDYGFFVSDSRCLGRIANIEASGATNIFDPSLAIDILNEMLMDGFGAIMYCNSKVKSQIDKLAMDKSNVYYTMGEEFGRPVTLFRGIPVRRMQAILNTETAVA